MLTRLYLDNCFTHQDREIIFDRGLTGVIGPNESGKSLIVEMIRYALFGSKALRGKAEQYKKLHVELDFEVRGESFRVVRKPNKVTLTGTNQEVSGTRPVDEAIKTLLGYDMTVFDVANACNQGEVDGLSKMTPTARKAMVDRTVGLTVLDDLIKFTGQEGNALKREADAILNTLVLPVDPVIPEDYQESSSIDLASARDEQKEFNQLAGVLSNVVEKPKKPAKCKVSSSREELVELMDHRNTVIRNLKALQGQVRTLEPEDWTASDLDEFEQWHEDADAWEQKTKLLARGYHQCPACKHEWPIADLGDVADAPETTRPTVTRAQIREQRTRLGNREKIAELTQAIEELEEAMPEDVTDQLAIVEAHKADMQAYENQLASFNKYNEGLAEKRARFEELQGIDERVSNLETQLREAEQYERDYARWFRSFQQYEQNLANAGDITSRSEDFLKARDLIQAMKTKVKTYLLPSMNKVASSLLSQMTAGVRYSVEIDEDFEITIDGQPINTLSGSGTAVANLAIRIALGQILTNKVFSVFLADEVDAAMDEERASYTAEALQRLTKHVSQVIQVTHKTPETDHVVELKKA